MMLTKQLNKTHEMEEPKYCHFKRMGTTNKKTMVNKIGTNNFYRKIERKNTSVTWVAVLTAVTGRQTTHHSQKKGCCKLNFNETKAN